MNPPLKTFSYFNMNGYVKKVFNCGEFENIVEKNIIGGYDEEGKLRSKGFIFTARKIN